MCSNPKGYLTHTTEKMIFGQALAQKKSRKGESFLPFKSPQKNLAKKNMELPSLNLSSKLVGITTHPNPYALPLNSQASHSTVVALQQGPEKFFVRSLVEMLCSVKEEVICPSTSNAKKKMTLLWFGGGMIISLCSFGQDMIQTIQCSVAMRLAIPIPTPLSKQLMYLLFRVAGSLEGSTFQSFAKKTPQRNVGISSEKMVSFFTFRIGYINSIQLDSVRKQWSTTVMFVCICIHTVYV